MMTDEKKVRKTGPISARGKANSSRNAQKHGLLSRHLILPGEDGAEFELLLVTLQNELRPVGLLENSLTERMAVTLWRQRRLVKAESAGIALRAKEHKGPVSFEFNKYIASSANPFEIESALEADSGEYFWERVFNEVNGFDPTQANALAKLEDRAPHAYSNLAREAQVAGKSIEDHLAAEYQDLEGFLDWWRERHAPRLKMEQTIRAFRDSRALPENPDILVRYQSGLDNELYKAPCGALREAQAWRLSTLEQLDSSV